VASFSLFVATTVADTASITNFSAALTTNGVTVQFSLANASNAVPYNLYGANSLTQKFWTYLGPIFASNTYTFSNQMFSSSWYRLSGPPVTMVVAWGDDYYNEADVPPGLTNVIAVASGYEHNLALQSEGTLVSWGYTNATANWVPTNLPRVKAIAAGWYYNVALLQDGTVTNWGPSSADLYDLTAMPAGLTNVTAIAASAQHSMALRADGKVLSWGKNNSGETNVPTDLTNVVAIAAGGMHSLAVKADGTVVAWGDNGYGQSNVPSGLSNVTAVAAGWVHSLALKGDGTVVAWGDDSYGQSIVPPGLSNVISIAAGSYSSAPGYSLALQKDGTVVAWGSSPVMEMPSGMDGVVGISAGAYHAAAIRYARLAPVIIHQPAIQYQITGQPATFTIGPETYGVPTYQWQAGGTNIPGATNSSLTLSSVGAAQQQYYSVIISDTNGSIVSTSAAFVLVTAPAIISLSQASNQYVADGNNWTLSVGATAPGQEKFPISYQWQFNGTNIAAATASSYTLTANTAAAGAYSVIVSNAAGATNATWQIGLLVPGSVTAWGDNGSGPASTPLLTNVLAVAAGRAHSLALREDGTVVGWGDNAYGQTNTSGLANVAAIAAGDDHGLGLKTDGTVVGWGRTNFAQTSVPANLTNAVAISSGGYQSLALKKDGTVVQWGQTFAPVPPNMTNVAAIASGTNFHLALLSNSTVVAWGGNSSGQTQVPSGLTSVVAIAAGGAQALALRSDGTVTNWGATVGSIPSGLTNAMAVAAGYAHAAALRNDGSVVTWGDNSKGQTNLGAALSQVKSIAAGGNHTLAAIFSPLVQYPVDVTKDLLLVYNSSSTNSIVVKDYYLGHRPLAGGANVLGFACFTNEQVDLVTFSSQIAAPVLQWFTNNPTKHPLYLILFPDIPIGVHFSLTANSNDCPTGYCPYASVAYAVKTNVPGIQPFITSINMGFWDLTNDCIAYINKLATIGASNSPGQLILSASAGGYGNTNYVLDDIRHGTGYTGPPIDYDWTSSGWRVSDATNALLAAGVSPAAILFFDGLETLSNGVSYDHIHPTGMTNLAGHITWGSHSSLANDYARNGTNVWGGASGWWIIETFDSFNGWRWPGQGNFTQFFSDIAFGGSTYTHYENTPVGAVTHTDDPDITGVEDAAHYFGLWASGKVFAICAWHARNSTCFQAVGDPLVRR
jgi:alpha-tubulin suppressor-like RCC1 family protein